MKKTKPNNIKNPKLTRIFFNVIFSAIVFFSTYLLPLQIIAESNLNDTKARSVGNCKVGQELVESVTKIQNGNNVTFTNTAFAGTLQNAVFNGMNQFQGVGTGWIPFPGENHRLIHADGRIFQFLIFDKIKIYTTTVAAAVKVETVKDAVYEVLLPYEYEIGYAKGDEYQSFIYELFNSNIESLKSGSVPLTFNMQSGTVNYTFIGTGTTVGLAFGLNSSSILYNNNDQRYLTILDLSVKMKQRIQQVFPDLNLAKAVATKLGKHVTDFVTKLELDSIKDLEAPNKSIQNLSGMECLINIQDINFSSNQISDLSPLSGLTKLNVLNLSNNLVSNLNPLSVIKSLKELYLNSNQISDISELPGLTQLTTLSLNFNQIRDVSPLSWLTNLTELFLESNQIRDVDSLSGLTKLTNLNLSVNQISDVSSLKGLINIRTINLANQSIQLSQGTIGVPTSFSLLNPNMSVPPVIWSDGTGTYENGQLIWSTTGVNKFTWNNYVTIGNSGSDFYGQVTQYNLGFLHFKKIPDSIIFPTSTISSTEKIIHRDDSNWEMSVFDDLPGRNWHITASINTPLTSTSNSSHKLLNALVYIDDAGNTTPLSTTPLKVFEYTTGEDSITPIHWDREKGILLKTNPAEVYIESYQTMITWTLCNTP
ncbi:leucine-rich repeat domain-containing protein [Bacillus sp. EAC]|uniref:leucine-rich repeat domain-containing protein n=1 Tax=Bacillus sp. EAC TaxID=1978338 RepID=UPI000B443BF0|nr:leucine-rich repeat domain-containing protein [Bacillus sp. EAC]